MKEYECKDYSDLKAVKTYLTDNNLNLDDVNQKLEEFQACKLNQICCGSVLVDGKTVDDWKTLAYPDLEKNYIDVSIEDKAFLLEKMDKDTRSKLLESTDSNDKQHIWSNYPRLFAQAKEQFTWERRWKLENFSKTIEDLTQATYTLSVSYGGSNLRVHDLLLEDRVIKSRKAYVDQVEKVREKKWLTDFSAETNKKVMAFLSNHPSDRTEFPSTNFGRTIIGIPNKLRFIGKQEKNKMTQSAAYNELSDIKDLERAMYLLPLSNIAIKDKNIAGAKTNLASVRVESKLELSRNSIQGFSGGIKKIKEGNAITRVSGVLDMLGSVAVFAGPAGTLVSAGCGLVNSILDAFGLGGPSVQEQVGKMIDAQTEEIRDMISEQTREITNIVNAQTREIQNMINQQTRDIKGYLHGLGLASEVYLDDKLWKEKMTKMVSELRAFQEDQANKYAFMSSVLSKISAGKPIPPEQLTISVVLHGRLFDDQTLYEAAAFFKEECRFVSRLDKQKRICDKLLFTYIGVATIRDLTQSKLVSVLAAGNAHIPKDAVLGHIKRTKKATKKFLGHIFTTLSLDNGFSCEYSCPLTTVNGKGLLLTDEESQLILNYVASLGITSQATVDSCKKKCPGRV